MKILSGKILTGEIFRLHIVNGSMQLRKLSSLSTTGMALLRYLQALPRRQLPDPIGALSFSLPSSAIAEANAAVTNARHQEKATKAKRGPYMKLSNELKSKSLVRTETLRQQLFSKLLETAKLPC